MSSSCHVLAQIAFENMELVLEIWSDQKFVSLKAVAANEINKLIEKLTYCMGKELLPLCTQIEGPLLLQVASDDFLILIIEER